MAKNITITSTDTKWTVNYAVPTYTTIGVDFERKKSHDRHTKTTRDNQKNGTKNGRGG